MEKKADILKWILEMGIKTNKGQKIEFNDHGFLLDYLLDDAQRIVIRKSTQVGATFTTILKILYLGYKDPLSIIYTMPTTDEARDLVVSKFDPIVERSPGLRNRVQKVELRKDIIWSTVLKRIGESYYFFKSSWVSWKAHQIDADVLVIDELDFQKPEVRKMYEERLEGSKSKDIIYWLGYPSIPNFGIAEIFEKSDQRFWWIKCPHCLKKQTLDWPDSIDIKKKVYICKFCKKELSDEVRKRGVWIPKYPGRKIHGYAMNKLIAPWVPASKIVQSYFEDTPKHFYNYTLAVPYQESKNDLTEEIIMGATITDELFEKLRTNQIVCGIDQGDQFHLIAGVVTPHGPIAYRAEVLRDANELEKTLDLLQPQLTVIDGRPDRHLAKLFQDKYGHDRFYLANLRDWGENSIMTKGYKDVKRALGVVNLERTETLDHLFKLLKDATIKLKGSMPQFHLVIKHLRNLVPDYMARYNTIRKVWRRVGPDHFAHALSFMNVAYEILTSSAAPMPIELDIPEEISRYIPGSPEWLRLDLERMAMKLSYSGDTIVIQPKDSKENKT